MRALVTAINNKESVGQHTHAHVYVCILANKMHTTRSFDDSASLESEQTSRLGENRLWRLSVMSSSRVIRGTDVHKRDVYRPLMCARRFSRVKRVSPWLRRRPFPHRDTRRYPGRKHAMGQTKGSLSKMRDREKD